MPAPGLNTPPRSRLLPARRRAVRGSALRRLKAEDDAREFVSHVRAYQRIHNHPDWPSGDSRMCNEAFRLVFAMLDAGSEQG